MPRIARLLPHSALLALSLLAPTHSTHAQGRALTIEDYYRLKAVGAPAMSPDGRWLAFTVITRIEATNGDSSEVWLAGTEDARSPLRVSARGTHATLPEWSSDGRLTYRATGRRWSVNPETPDSVAESPSVAPQSGRVTGGDRVLSSPDGKLVAIVRTTPVPKRERGIVSDFEKRHEERFKGVQFDWLDFQRDGQPFPVPNRVDPDVNPPQEIFLASNGDSATRQLTRLSLRPAGVEWSPDGTTLLFTADMDYRDERRYASNDVYAVSLDGRVRRLTTDSTYNHSNARYSPDGRWILYTRQLSTDAVIAKRLDHGGPTDLAVMPAAGGAERILTAEWDYLPSNARWSPDGRFVYFTGGVGGTTQLFRVAASGGPVQPLTKGARRISGISFDWALSKMAYTVGLIETPAEIYVANIDGSNERRITHVHDAFTSDVALSKAERLLFKSKDGTEVEGWLLYPFGYRRDGGPYPLIVSNHGGPHSADGYSFDFKNQFFAANGYFVLEVNFRSSTGYGEKFLWGTWGAWGNKDGEDVIAGIDHALQRAPIDRRRVATIGHSYGGFMTNWLITQYPDRFAAAIAGAGIVNWVSDYGTADIARTKETEFFGTPWDARAREIMIRQSPLTYAHRVKAPTLFIHGELDQRVPYSEAEQMFVALKKNGVPAKVILYAGMAHGISGSWNVVHRMISELRWLETHLKKGGMGKGEEGKGQLQRR
jgi:dipeptidyl aminopeptidase/acylaminoacyl peptidase